MSELNREIINRLAREAGMTRAVGVKRNAWHGWEHELEEFAKLVAGHVRDSETTAWVIEGAWSSVANPDYWLGSSAWSPDHLRALRFARRDDAQQAARMMLDGINVRICEHAWRLPDQPSAAPKGDIGAQPHPYIESAGWCAVCGLSQSDTRHAVTVPDGAASTTDELYAKEMRQWEACTKAEARFRRVAQAVLRDARKQKRRGSQP